VLSLCSHEIFVHFCVCYAPLSKTLPALTSLCVCVFAAAAPTVKATAAGHFARQRLAAFHASRGAVFAAAGSKTAAAVNALRIAVAFQGSAPGKKEVSAVGDNADGERVSLLVQVSLAGTPPLPGSFFFLLRK